MGGGDLKWKTMERVAGGREGKKGKTTLGAAHPLAKYETHRHTIDIRVSFCPLRKEPQLDVEDGHDQIIPR